MISWLQQWYIKNCDGDWEHENGVRIETLDNPGWCVTIDLNDTGLDGVEIPYVLNEVSDEIWTGYSIVNNIFKGVSSVGELNKLIEIFRDLSEYYEKKI